MYLLSEIYSIIPNENTDFVVICTGYTPTLVHLVSTKSKHIMSPKSSCSITIYDLKYQNRWVKIFFLQKKKKKKKMKKQKRKSKSYQMTFCLMTFTELINSSYLMEMRLRSVIYFPRVFLNGMLIASNRKRLNNYDSLKSFLPPKSFNNQTIYQQTNKFWSCTTFWTSDAP